MISNCADRSSLPVCLTWSRFNLVMGSGIICLTMYFVSVIAVLSPFLYELIAVRLL